MYQIIQKQILNKNIKRLDILAKDVACKVKPGQFVILMVDDHETWIPITVAEADSQRGVIAIIFKETEPIYKPLAEASIHQKLFSVLGPFGKEVKVKNNGVVICAAESIHATQILPICRALKRGDNKVIGVMSAKTKQSLILETQMRIACHKLLITTEDGSYERRGSAASALREISDQEKVDFLYAAGSLEMMKDVYEEAREKSIRTQLQLPPTALCRAPSCGSCRIKVAGDTLLICEDGPGFDGKKIDFDSLKVRMEIIESLVGSSKKDLKQGGVEPTQKLVELFTGTRKVEYS